MTRSGSTAAPIARKATAALGLDARRRARAEHRSGMETLTGKPGRATLPPGFRRHRMVAAGIVCRIPTLGGLR